MTTKQHQNYPFRFILLFSFFVKGDVLQFQSSHRQYFTQDLLLRDHDFPSKNAMFAFKTIQTKCVCDFSWPNTKHYNSRLIAVSGVQIVERGVQMEGARGKRGETGTRAREPPLTNLSPLHHSSLPSIFRPRSTISERLKQATTQIAS